jgi:hypothetical protein
MDPKGWSGQTKATAVIAGTAGLFLAGFLLCRADRDVGVAWGVGAAAYTVAFVCLVFRMTGDG